MASKSRLSNLALAIGFVFIAMAGFLAGRWTAPETTIHLVSDPVSDAVTIAESQDRLGSIDVYHAGAFAYSVKPEDNERFAPLMNLLKEANGPEDKRQ